MMHLPTRTLTALAVLAVVTAACSTDDGRQMQRPLTTDVATIGSTPNTQATDSGWTLTAPWEDGAEVNVRYTCDGEGVSPPLVWTPGPEMTRAYGVVLAVADEPETILWAMADIPSQTRNLVEGLAPEGAISAVNSGGTLGYQPPCPNVEESQEFELSVYAQQFPIELPQGSPAIDVAVALDNDALEIVTTRFSYQRR